LKRITNSRQTPAILLAALLFLTLSNCAIRERAKHDQPIAQIQAGESWQTIQSGPTERRYLLNVPAT
jgi:hypothetical protein